MLLNCTRLLIGEVNAYSTIADSSNFHVCFFSSPTQGQEQIVFAGTPLTRVESDIENTERSVLDSHQIEEYRVLITKRDGRYFWWSRERKELMYFKSGIAHWFVSPTSGYIKIIDPSLRSSSDIPNQYYYVEHLTLLTTTLTYWGSGEDLDL